MIDHEQATAGVRNTAGAAPADRLLERLAELIGARAGVQAVFGEAVRQDGLTVVPVARLRWGFGGGSGRSAAAFNGPASEIADRICGNTPRAEPGSRARRRPRLGETDTNEMRPGSRTWQVGPAGVDSAGRHEPDERDRQDADDGRSHGRQHH